jgi:DNA-binding transcriptional MerR regulator
MKTSKKQTKPESRKRNYTKPDIKKREQIKEVTEGGVPTVTHVVVSDRNAKKNFQSVDTVAVLEKLAAIPIERWNYQWEKDSDVPHLGPMAQDFKGAFYPGRDDKTISMLEFDGVALAALQGLNQKLDEKDAEIQTLKQSVAELKQLVSQLTRN